MRHQYYIRAPRAEVFRALSDPALIVRWLSDEAEIEPRSGGSYRLAWKQGPTHVGTVAEFIPGRRLALTWQWEGIRLRGTVLVWGVQAKRRGTLLSVEHAGFPSTPRWTALYASAEWGWTYFAMNLKSFLECGRDLRSPYDA